MTPQAWATLTVGLIGIIGVIWTVRQRDLADRRDEWWRRAAWATDHTLTGDLEAQRMAFGVLQELERSPLLTEHEGRLLVVMSMRPKPKPGRRGGPRS